MTEHETDETASGRHPTEPTTAMVTALVRMRGALQETRLPLELPGAEEQRASRAEMVDQLEDYVIPRLMTIDAPLPTMALLASFHSGRWVFSQMPAPGMKLESLASNDTSSFSVK